MSKYPNVIQCMQCGMILVSFHVHDYKTCLCPNETMIDGGSDYLRCGGMDLTKIQVLQIRKPKPPRTKYSDPV